MAPNSIEAVLPADTSLVGRRRMVFQYRPDHPEGVTFGFLFRFLVAMLSVFFGTAFLFFAGLLFTDWQLTTPLLVIFGLFIVGIIYIGEHFRSQIFERVVSDERAGEIEADKIDESVLQELKELASLSPAGRVTKRTFDFAFATMALVLEAPLLVMIALAIKMDSRGPVLICQTGHGYNNETIKMFKFRTLKTQLEDGDDRRITKVGAILRRTHLDELPQLINVLRGEMSIVGPRPFLTAHNHGGEIAPGFKPGITGWAQVHGYHGLLNTLEKMQTRVEYDLWYFHNWSIFLDLRIIIMTLYKKAAFTNAF